MKRELTNFEWLFGLVRLGVSIATLIVLSTLGFVGCASAWKPVKQYEVKPFSIVMGSHDFINQMRQALDPQAGVEVDGFIHYPSRTVYVPYSIKKDDNGNDKPDFEVLGHEVWHLPELGGRWHE